MKHKKWMSEWYVIKSRVVKFMIPIPGKIWIKTENTTKMDVLKFSTGLPTFVSKVTNVTTNTRETVSAFSGTEVRKSEKLFLYLI